MSESPEITPTHGLYCSVNIWPPRRKEREEGRIGYDGGWGNGRATRRLTRWLTLTEKEREELHPVQGAKSRVGLACGV